MASKETADGALPASKLQFFVEALRGHHRCISPFTKENKKKLTSSIVSKNDMLAFEMPTSHTSQILSFKKF